jgi:hypothetical protein
MTAMRRCSTEYPAAAAFTGFFFLLFRSVISLSNDRANTGDIKEKFDELKGYALSLEREITDLKSKKKNPVNAAAAGYSVLHLLIAVIVSLLVYKLIPRFI